MTNALPVAMSIAGSDCSAGAGIQADLKTFQSFHVHGLTALTCVVAETALVVRSVHPLPLDIVRDQISLLLDTFPVAAVKTGMLFSAAIVQTVAAILKTQPQLVLVVDPVMIASSGEELLEQDALSAYRNLLLPMARVITPNLPEAESLLGEPIPNEAAMESAARRLSEQFNTAVLLKGGHLLSENCLDLLVDHGKVYHFSATRIPVAGSHGTGCTFSAAITAALAHGHPLPDAVEQAKHYLGQTLRHSYAFPSPCGGSLHALNQGTRPP